MIDIKDLCKVYLVGDERVRALDHATLHIYPKEFVSIIGPSGSGKSTFGGFGNMGFGGMSGGNSNQMPNFSDRNFGNMPSGSGRPGGNSGSDRPDFSGNMPSGGFPGGFGG